MKGAKYGYRRDANYTEDVVALAIESFLTILSFPFFRFSIEPFSRSQERYLGADARLSSKIVGFRPFYLQFKRPSAYPDYSSSSIIKDRKNLGLSVQPSSLFFGLRKKAAHHSECQHNILFKLRARLQARGVGDAAYVCPLFLDRAAYRFHVHLAGVGRFMRFWHHMPWDLESVLLTDGARNARFDRIPIFEEHVSIPPHQVVPDTKHSYSFSEVGSDLCFHSPTALPEGALKFSSFLKSIARGFLDGGDLVRMENANSELSGMFLSEPNSAFARLLEFDPNADPLANWLTWGQVLHDAFEIEQYAMVLWRNDT